MQQSLGAIQIMCDTQREVGDILFCEHVVGFKIDYKFFITISCVCNLKKENVTGMGWDSEKFLKSVTYDLNGPIAVCSW